MRRAYVLGGAAQCTQFGGGDTYKTLRLLEYAGITPIVLSHISLLLCRIPYFFVITLSDNEMATETRGQCHGQRNKFTMSVGEASKTGVEAYSCI